MRRVVITGLGAVTPIGGDAESTWEAMKAGRSGVGPITTFDASSYPVRIAGMIKDFDPHMDLPGPRFARHLHRAATFGVAASVEALADARLLPGVYPPEESGVAIGASVARPELQEFSDIFATRQGNGGTELLRAPPSRTLRVSQNTAAVQIARLAGCEGPFISVSTACTASAHAIGEAFRRIQDGEARMMVAGGHDALTGWVDILGFSLLGALTRDYNDDPEHASRPFERDRSGFVLGEGGVMCVLEEAEAAQERGATIRAELVGYGSSLNAYRMTDPPPDGSGGVIAMNQALREAALAPEEIDYVAAHATGTPSGDLSENAAIQRVFGAHAPELAISSPKSMTGHTTAAAGALNVLAALGAMRDGVVSPTINLEHADPQLELNYVPNEAQEREVRAAMVNGFAFGGTNATLVLRTPEEVLS